MLVVLLGGVFLCRHENWPVELFIVELSYRLNLNDGTWHTSALLSISPRTATTTMTTTTTMTMMWQWRHNCCCSCHPLSIRHHKNYIPIRHRLLSTFYFDLLIDVYEYWYWYYYLLFWCNTAGTDKEMECVIPHHSSKIYLFRHNII